MSDRSASTSVRHSVVVEAAIEKAFRVFTGETSAVRVTATGAE
jgi:hypothetical protein